MKTTTDITAYSYISAKLLEWSSSLQEISELVKSEGGARPVHRYRVGLRRLRSCLPFLIPFHGAFYPEQLRKSIGRLARTTNQLRDDEVMLETLDGIILDRNLFETGQSHFPEFQEPHYQSWHRRIQTSIETARQTIRQSLQDGILQSILHELESLLVLPPQKKRKQSALAYGEFCVKRELSVVEKKLTRFERRSGKAEWLHDLRIDFKRLRYATDLFLTALPLQHADRMKFARKCQNRLGEIHDCDFIIERLQNEHDLDEDVRAWFIVCLQEKRHVSLQKLIKRLLKAGYAPMQSDSLSAPQPTEQNLPEDTSSIEIVTIERSDTEMTSVEYIDAEDEPLIIDDTVAPEDHVQSIESKESPATDQNPAKPGEHIQPSKSPVGPQTSLHGQFQMDQAKKKSGPIRPGDFKPFDPRL